MRRDEIMNRPAPLQAVFIRPFKVVDNKFRYPMGIEFFNGLAVGEFIDNQKISELPRGEERSNFGCDFLDRNKDILDTWELSKEDVNKIIDYAIDIPEHE